MNSFNTDELSPLLGRLCALKIINRKDHYIGVGKFMVQNQKPTVFFSRAAHLRKKGLLEMKVLGVIPSFVVHFQVAGFDLKPKGWQRIMMDRGDIFLSFQEKDIEEANVFLDFHTKSQL